MTKTNKILVAILAVLLLVLAAIGGTIAVRKNLFGSDLGDPFDGTRYTGMLAKGSELSGDQDDDAVPVVLVVRFQDDGERATLTSPTLQRHSELTRNDQGTYEETIITGEGVAGTWDFGGATERPAEDNDAERIEPPSPNGPIPSAELVLAPGEGKIWSLNISVTLPSGSTLTAELHQTDSGEIAGEVGLNPAVEAPELSEGAFGEDKKRTVGAPVFQPAGASPLLIGDPESDPKPVSGEGESSFTTLAPVDPSEDNEQSFDSRLGQTSVIFRDSIESKFSTVTYPELQCYGELRPIDGGGLEEHFLVGSCVSGGIWRWAEGTSDAGVREFISADKSVSARTVYRSTDWEDIDGEVGLSLTGPVVKYYENLQGSQDSATEPESEAAPVTEGEQSYQSRVQGGLLSAWGYGDITIGMTKQEAIAAGLDDSSIVDAFDRGPNCTIGDYQGGGYKPTIVYMQDDKVTAIFKNEKTGVYVNNNVIGNFDPDDSAGVYDPNLQPDYGPADDQGWRTWTPETQNGNTVEIGFNQKNSDVRVSVSVTGTTCRP